MSSTNSNPDALTIKVKRLHPDAVLPKHQTAGAACFDLAAVAVHEDAPDFEITDVLSFSRCICPGERVTFHVGFSVEPPPGYALKVYSRSGHGAHHGIVLANGTGVIDPDYRGPLKVCLQNNGSEPFLVKKGDRIAQAMLERVHPVELVEVDELTETARGAGGFGSTGQGAASEADSEGGEL
ncbi:dUTP diphosphatase [Caldimonas brevitalea]|uniref:dUTP diphosphatase n=1 Tax=Caldimonas brevitalea TaxID=413882 RepID=A0A0G3BHI1_9BURK|nr:dUTP diphosphatase [Caldimonas brevitalea]AKJ28792.1 dUTP pyrophosphatase [Caldimonas brevitalea]